MDRIQPRLREAVGLVTSSVASCATTMQPLRYHSLWRWLLVDGIFGARFVVAVGQ
ncbi:MAG: hypothetical protein IPN81_02725 [Nitrosomonadales bacterium]|nr:hypothetical protein [Nitrosomonadales bacterium]